jgi:hypothetical protein
LSLTGRKRRTLGGLVAVALTIAAAAACSSGGSGTATRKLPPQKKAAIEKVFASELDRLGLRLTRGAPVDLKTGKPSRTGTHLAVYVEPTGPYTADDYARRVVAVTKVFAPRSFDMWRGLTSFDVCQEPLPNVDTRPEPPPKTKVTMTRDAARAVHWKRLDLPTLLVDAKRLGSRALSVYADPEVRRTAMYQDAMVRAQASPATTPPTPAPSYER